MFAHRRVSSRPDLVGATLEAHLPDEDAPRALTIATDGSFEARLTTRLPRLRSAQRQLRFTLRHRGEQVSQLAPLFTLRPGATVGVIVLSDSPQGSCLSLCSRELTEFIGFGRARSESNPVFYLAIGANGKPFGTSIPAAPCPDGLAISVESQSSSAAIAVEQAMWIVRLMELFAHELEFVIVADTSPQNLATLRALARLGAPAQRLRAVFVSDTRPVARGVMLQAERPSGIDRLELPIVIVRTLDEARRAAATCGVTPITDPNTVNPAPATRRISATHARVTRYPLVFCHGMLGYSVLRLRPVNLENYFNGLREILTDRGFPVLMPELGRTHSIEQRAEQLRQAIGRWTREPVNIVAHSMGGLDARFLITKLGMADRVPSLTTIGTPHHGSYFADWFVDGFDAKLPFLRSLERVGVEVDGFHDCTRAACRVFNQTVPDSPKVRYFSYSAFQVARKIPPVLRRSHSLIARAEGANDGLVSELSARWGEHVATLRADHISLVGERGPEHFDHLALFTRIVDDLVRQGF
jgi:triacylglycerol lipase